MSLRATLLAATLLSLAGRQSCLATLVNGSTSLCQCTPRNATTSSYLNSLNSYTADMATLLSQISTQLSSLGLKFSDFSATTFARLLQISASNVEATNVVNALLASLNSNSSSSSSGTSSVSALNCTSQDSLAFFGSTVYQAIGYGATFSSGRWTVALSGAALTIDYGVKSCTTQTQYIQQICVDGHPSQVYIFVQANSSSSASLVTSSLTVSSQTGPVCVTVNQHVMAFTLLPKSLKTIFSLMPSYQFNLAVTGCFNAIPAACTPTVAPTTTIPCTFGNALADVAILPTTFFYNVQLSRIDGVVINANATGAAVATFLVDLTADGCRAEPNITQVCSAGNFKRMRIGRLTDYDGTIQEFPGSVNVTATNNYQRFCYNVNGKVAILAIQPFELFVSTDTQFKFFPEARGCYDPVTSACTARPACVGPLEVGWHSEQLPQQSLTTTNMTFTGGQWVTTGPDALLTVDLTAGGCRKTAAVTRVCVTSTNSPMVTLSAIFPVGEAQFASANNLTGTASPTVANPWCQNFSAAPTMQNLFISFPSAVPNTGVFLKWTITGCFSSLPAYCLTTTAAPVTTTVAPTTSRPAETCSSGLATLNNSDPNLPASAAISGATFVSASNSWTVAKGDSMTIDLTVGGCRRSARLLAICISGNAASVRIDYILEDNTRVILANSTVLTQPAAGVPLCFNFPSTVYAKSLVLLPTALKTASASDASYSMSVSLSGCYSTILASCYSPICACSASYRPVFYKKKYYRLYFRVTSGYYATYRSTYASPVTTDYQDLLNITDTVIWQNFGKFKDKYEAIDQVAFTNGSVVLNSRLIMYDGGYSSSELTTALASGVTGYTAGGTYGVDPPTVSITDYDSTSTVPPANTTTVAGNPATSAVNLALLLGLLIPLIIIVIVAIILLILLCKYRMCCCFAQKTEEATGKQAEADTTDGGKDNAGVSSSQDQLVPKDEPPQSARTVDYNYSESGPGEEPEKGKDDNQILPMPAPAFAPAPASQDAREYGTANVQTAKHPRKKGRSKHNTAVCPEPAADSAAAAASGGPGPSGRRPETPAPPWAPFPGGGPKSPKSVSVETTTYWIGGKR